MWIRGDSLGEADCKQPAMIVFWHAKGQCRHHYSSSLTEQMKGNPRNGSRFIFQITGTTVDGNSLDLLLVNPV